MKVCYLSDANSIHTKKMCEFFSERGYEIHVISLNYGEINNATVHSFDMDMKLIKNKTGIKKLKYISFIKEIRKIISKINPDIIHAHYASSYGLLGALSGKHPFVLSVWGSDVFDFPKKNFLNKILLKYNLSKADKILSTSSVMAKETALYTNKKVYVTPFGVDINFFKQDTSKRDEVKKEIVIGTIKSLEAHYGIEYLIRAFSEMTFTNQNLRLEIGGVGSQKEFLVSLSKELNIEDKVKFLGFLNRNDVVKKFNDFDIAVFPSTLESFGVAAVEAQACGIPVIVSNVGGLPEATSPNISSLLVEKGNIQELKEALEKLVNDSELRKTMGEAGRKFVEENYNIQDNFNSIDKIYKELINY